MSKIHQDRPVFGMLVAIGAYFLLAIMQMFGKLLSEHHSVIEIAFYRNLISVIPFLIYIFCWHGGKKILKIQKNSKAILARAVIGTFSLTITFGAFANLPMADATALIFTSSLLLPALSFFFLKEHVGPYRWAAIGIGFVGVLIMVQPTGTVNTLGVTFALIAAILHSVMGTLLRHLGKTENPATTTFYFVSTGLIMTALAMPFVATVPRIGELPLILGVGLSGALAQFMLSTAFKYAQGAIVTVFNYSGIIWATLFGWFIWNDWPAWPIWTGGTIVIASNLFILWRERRLARMTEARIRVNTGI